MSQTTEDDTVELPEPPMKKSRKYQSRSPAWDHFSRETNKEGITTKATCNYCGIQYVSNTRDHGTSNLNKHLKRCEAYLNVLNGGQKQIGIQQCGDEKKIGLWKFNQKDTRDALAHMIVEDELPFSFVENKGYRRFMSIACPFFKVPCRSTITKDSYQMFLERKNEIRDFMKRNIGRICLTTDGWTSLAQESYMCLTAHFIDNDWILRKKVLNFCIIESHTGVDIGKKIEKCLREWEIDNVFTISVDNAAANVKAIDFLKERFETLDNCLLKGEWTHMRCVAHILNLVVQDGIKKVGKPVENVRFAVKWIRLSPSRIAKFHKFAEDVNCDSKKHLVRDVPTRWNSTYNMLEVAQAYEKAFHRYNLEEIDFGKDVNEAGFSVPSKEDWVKVRDLCHFLKHFYDVTMRVSGTSYPTSNSCIEDIGEIRILLNDSLVDPKNQLYDIALAMKVKFDKYFGEVKGMNLLLYFSLLLDPRNKKKYFNIVLDDHYGRRGKQILSEKKGYILENLDFLYADYVRIHSSSSKTESSSSSTILGKRSNPNDMVSKPPLPGRNKLRERMEVITMEPMNELEKYFSEVEEINSDNFDILAWWKVNSPRFPTLSTMARDMLAIPVSTVASESVFSTSGRILDAFRSSLTPKIAESIICTQDWIRSSTSGNPEIEEDFDTIQHISKELGATWST